MTNQEDRQIIHLASMIHTACGGNHLWSQRISSARSLDQARVLAEQAAKREGLPQTRIFSSDLDRICKGESPEYFLHPSRFVALYRQRRGLSETCVSRLASPEEQQDFYGSELWERCRKVVYFLDRYTCAICGAHDTVLHAHHFDPIYSPESRVFHKNFDPCRMKAWCKPCHVRWHRLSRKTTHGFEPAS